MKILLFKFFYTQSSLGAYYDHFYRWFIQNLDKEKVDIKLLLYEKQYNENLSNNVFGDICIKPLTDKDIEYIFDGNFTFEQIYEKVHFTNLNKLEINRLQEIYKNKFGEWEPDIILGLGAYSTYQLWKEVFPKAFYLTQENAIFSRPPFLRTLAYEPYNHVINSFPIKFKNEINNITISKKDDLKLNKFKKQLIKVIGDNLVIKKEIKNYKKKFKKVVLLPLTGNEADTLFHESLYGSGLEMVDYIMSKIPENIGVFVTQHDTVVLLDKKEIHYLMNKYPNFIYLKETDVTGCANNSLCYFKYVDAILNITSKTGLMSLIYDKPVLSLVKTYNDWFKDGQGIEDLEKVLKQPKKNKNNILYWYLTHYILFEKDFYKEDFLYNYLKEKLEKFRKNGITFEFYSKIYSLDEIHNYVINSVIQYYGYITSYEKLKNFLNSTKDKSKQLLNSIKNAIILILNKIKNYIKYAVVVLKKIVQPLYKITKYYIITK